MSNKFDSPLTRSSVARMAEAQRKLCNLIFLWLLSLYQDKESNRKKNGGIFTDKHKIKIMKNTTIAALLLLLAGCSGRPKNTTRTEQTVTERPTTAQPVTAEQQAEARQIVDSALAVENAPEFWNAFFVDNETDATTVRAIVNLFLAKVGAHVNDSEKCVPFHNNIIALTQAAIANNAGQPWMYEALAISLYSTKAPQEEIERAVLSAADFAVSPYDVMNLGLFMRGIGLQERAFVMYRQALESLPPYREFYLSAFSLAEEIYENDATNVEPLRWISMRILSNEWEGQQGKALAQKALDRMQALEVKWNRDGKTEEAARLAAEVRDARLRDCVVTVEWTGEAGLDMAVREPTNSICWFDATRTASDGVLHLTPVVNDSEIRDVNQTGVKRISYVCPRGFNGQYSILLQKEWGNLANDMAKVTVQTNVVPGDDNTEGKLFEVSQTGTIVNFDLTLGRRTEPLSEAELNVAQVQATMTSQMVNRNLALQRLNDTGVLAQVVGDFVGGSGEGGSAADPGNVDSLFPFYYRRSAIGYRPITQWLPEGVYFEADAVVSPDRRYVRIRANPPFYDIRDVTTFNYMSGESDLGGGSGTGSNSMGGF